MLKDSYEEFMKEYENNQRMWEAGNIRPTKTFPTEQSRRDFLRDGEHAADDVNELLYWFESSGGIVPDRVTGEENYVYVVLNNVRTCGDVIYIGTGKGARHMHVNSGKSHNKELNRMYFANEPADKYLFADGLTKDDAGKLERDLIAFFNPLANIAGLTYMSGRGYESPYFELMKLKINGRGFRPRSV